MDDQGSAWSACRQLVYYFALLQVPLFAMISGYICALRLVQSVSIAFVAVFAFQRWITLFGNERVTPTRRLLMLMVQLTGNALLIRF